MDRLDLESYLRHRPCPFGGRVTRATATALARSYSDPARGTMVTTASCAGLCFWWELASSCGGPVVGACGSCLGLWCHKLEAARLWPTGRDEACTVWVDKSGIGWSGRGLSRGLLIVRRYYIILAVQSSLLLALPWKKKAGENGSQDGREEMTWPSNRQNEWNRCPRGENRFSWATKVKNKLVFETQELNKRIYSLEGVVDFSYTWRQWFGLFSILPC